MQRNNLNSGLPKIIPIDSKRWRCGHCHGAHKPEDCKKCGREMCDSCISHHPDYGPVCGLCYDHIVEGDELK